MGPVVCAQVVPVAAAYPSATLSKRQSDHQNAFFVLPLSARLCGPSRRRHKPTRPITGGSEPSVSHAKVILAGQVNAPHQVESSV